MVYMNHNLPKIISVLGVTASGKTGLAVKLAQKINGEIISADSRQIYKEFNIGTAKPLGRWMQIENRRVFMVSTIPHHLIDMVDPKEDFTLADYKTLAIEKIDDVLARGKLPLLVGGTALYLKAVLENWGLPQAQPDLTLRRKLENKNPTDLYNELKNKDPEGAHITGSHNKRRIIRALEVIYQTAKKFSEQRRVGPPIFDVLKIGLKISKEDLSKNINHRTGEMIKNGLADEVKQLNKKYPWNLPPMQSIGYSEFRNYFEGKINLADTTQLIEKHSIAYAKRQMTWFKKDKTIHWIESEIEAEKLVENFLL